MKIILRNSMLMDHEYVDTMFVKIGHIKVKMQYIHGDNYDENLRVEILDNNGELHPILNLTDIGRVPKKLNEFIKKQDVKMFYNQVTEIFGDAGDALEAIFTT